MFKLKQLVYSIKLLLKKTSVSFSATLIYANF